MIRYLTILFGLFTASIWGQTKYVIKDFSEKYMGILTIEDGYEREMLKKGEISIFENHGNKDIITIQSEGFTFELNENGGVETKTLELPYEKQSILIYQDFNFDGKKDMAIMDGQFSSYHGPSFQIYLEGNGGLEHSPEFTRLAHEYSGMFQIDYDKETIQTSTNSGCCWHQFSKFKVIENKPMPISIVERGFSPDCVTENYVEKKRVGNRMVEEKYSYLSDEADINSVYSLFFENGKKMELYRAFSFEDYLFCVFLDDENKIELIYQDNFIYDHKNNTLTFTNQNITYKVYAEGIFNTTPKTNVNMKAVSAGKNTTLHSLSELFLKNLTIE